MSSSVSAVEVRRTMIVAFSVVLITPTCTLVSKVLSGYQESHVYSIISAVGSIGSLIGMYFGVHMHFAMPMLFLCATGATTFAGLLGLLWTLRFYKPWLSPKVSHLSLSTARSLISRGSSFLAVQLASIVVFNSDNLIVGHYLGVAEVTPYSLAMRFMAYAQLLPSFIYPSLWPAYAEADAQRDYGWIRKTFRKAVISSLAVMGVSLLAAVLWGRLLLRLWVGGDALPSQSLWAAMAFWTLLVSMTNVTSCLLNAVGWVRLQGITSCIAAVVNLGLSILLVQKIGSLGVVLATIVSYILFLIAPQIWEVRKYFAGTAVVESTI